MTVILMWNECHPIPEVIEVFNEGEVWRLPLSMEEGLLVCEHCLFQDHESGKCKKEGREKGKEDEGY